MNTSMPANDCYGLVTKIQSSFSRATAILAGAVRLSLALMLALMFWMPASHLQADSVTVTITVDNGYGFGFGDQNGIYAGQYYGGVDNCLSSQIFGSPCYVFVPPDNPTAKTDTGAEIYNITAGANDYIYIVAWSDDSQLQGAVASFTDNNTSVTVTTSPAWPWQVYATGTNWQPNCTSAGTHGPPLTGPAYAINNQIAVANANAGGPGTSVTWVNNVGSPNGRLDFSGQFNGNTYPYAAPSCIAPGALWMEYNPEPTNASCNPFAWGSVFDYYSTPNFLREYQIYRIGPLGQIVGASCLQVQCSTNKTVQCGSGWTFDQPIFSSCCTNLFGTGVPGGGTNVMIVSTGIVTNGACPQMDVTQSWLVTDACGNSTNCSQTVTVLGCCADCLQVVCPTNKTVDCASAWTFDQPTATTCCTNEIITATGIETNVIITSTGIVTNGICPLIITQTWQISDACSDTNVCSQTVTVMNTNPPVINCPSNIVIAVTNCTTGVPVCYKPTAIDPCTGSNITVACSPPSCSDFTPGTVTTVNCTATNCSGFSNSCSFTVTINCCTNQELCCGPNLGAQTIQWLQLPTNAVLIPNPSGGNTTGTWIITNLPCYGRVLVTQDAPTNVLVFCTNSYFGRVHSLSVFDNVPNTNGIFDFTESVPGLYGPYSWGVNPGAVELGYGYPYSTSGSNGPLPSYKVNFYFLDGQPNPCSLVLAAIGLAQHTTNTVSQPVTFRTEYDLLYDSIIYSNGPSADTMLDGVYGPPMASNVSGTVVSSAYAANGGDDFNTGWAIFQPTNSLLTTSLPPGSGTDVNGNSYPSSGSYPHLSITVDHQFGDIFTITVGYICCPDCSNNCLQVQCPTNKTVQCGTTWTFDQPSAYSCCTNYTTNAIGVLTNLTITTISTVTNGQCPQYITNTWSIYDNCGNTDTCSQVVTVVNTNAPTLTCSSNLTVSSGQAWSFTPPTVVDACCSNVTIVVLSTSTNVSFNPCAINYTRTWQAIDCCSNRNTCSQTVTVIPTGPCQVFNTGMNGPAVLPGNAIDPNYGLVSEPAGSMGTLPNAVVIFPANANSSYVSLPDNSVSQWIGPDPFANFNQGEEPAGVYHYQLKFLLCCTNGAQLSGRMAADNTAGVYLNVSQFVASVPGFTTWTPINAVSGFVVGLNTLDIYLTNNSSSGDPGFSPTAFRSEVTICTTPLLVFCPTNKTVQCGSTWTFDTPSASSCCGGKVFINSTSIVTNGTCPKYITNSWLIHDSCGNTDTCSQVVTMVDTTPPTIVCPTNIIVVALNANCQLVIPYISVSATDNCTPLCQLVYSQSPTNGTIINGTNAYVTVTVTDLCGNSSQCTVHVQGVNRRGLVVSWPASITVTNCLVPCASNYVRATDCSCPLSALHITQSPPCDSPIGPGVSSITVTVTDCNGAIAIKVIPLNALGASSFLYALTNTGISVSGTLLPNSAVDPHYTLGPVAAPPPTGYVAPNAVVVSNLWGPLGSSLSLWIAPAIYLPPNYNVYTCQDGDYTYTNKFVLPAGANPATASISGRWAADDGSVAMYLNGSLTPNTIASPGFGHWTPFTISSGFVAGANTIRFVVTNSVLYGLSPSGLRVEYLSATACAPCAPPSILWITPSQTLQQYSSANFNVYPGGTPPFSYQWKFNGGSIAGATTPNLHLPFVNFSSGGLYSVIVSNPCGVATGYVRLTVTSRFQWTNAWWTFSSPASPLSATFGPDLVLAGTNVSTNFALSTGTTEDFGLPNPGGQIVNVMNINPQAGASIQVPLIAPTGSSSVDSYSVIMDLYEPNTSLGIPSTLFQSISCCVSNLGSGGQDGVALTLDAANYLHITGSAAGAGFDAASAAPLPVDAWNRVALVVNNPQDGGALTLDAYLNGQNVATLPYLCPCCLIPFTASSLNWAASSPIILSAQANAASPNAEFYVSGVQFHAAALTPQMIAGIGSPDDGPVPQSDTAVGSQPVLSTTESNGIVNISWTGSPYVLQETTDLSSGVWVDSTLPFTQSQVSGNILTTAVATPSSEGPRKFYRLIFRP